MIASNFKFSTKIEQINGLWSIQIEPFYIMVVFCYKMLHNITLFTIFAACFSLNAHLVDLKANYKEDFESKQIKQKNYN